MGGLRGESLPPATEAPQAPELISWRDGAAAINLSDRRHETPVTASEERLRSAPWRSLRGLAADLEPALGRVLGGDPAERVVDRFLRHHRELGRDARAAAAEALFGVGLWRRRLAWHAAAGEAGDVPPRALLGALLRDLGGLDGALAEELSGLPRGALPAPRPPPPDPAIRLSFPGWLWQILAREAGPEAEALADALNLPGPVCLRPNALRTSPEALASRLSGEGVATRPGRLVPSALVVVGGRPNVYGLASHREGLFEVQDEGSQLAGGLLRARPGEAVLDLCAGAGGKALQLAAAVGVDGSVHATDVDPERLARLRARARRAGASAIVAVHGASVPAGLEVDGALVDAPCSELGALRRGPDARFRLAPGSFQGLPALQRSLLARAAAHVRRGGRLVYATCTLRAEENEEVALAFEEAHPGFVRAGRPPVPRARDDAAAPGGFVRTWPHRHGCDGFFAAAWTRAS